jgi:hypothetical protein
MIKKANENGSNENSRNPHDPRKLACQSQMNAMLNTMFDIKGNVHFKFILKGQTINQTYYVEMVKRLREAVRRKRPEL